MILDFARSTCSQRYAMRAPPKLRPLRSRVLVLVRRNCLAKKIGWTDDVMGRRCFCFSHLHYAAFLGSSEFMRLCTRSHKMQTTQFTTCSQNGIERNWLQKGQTEHGRTHPEIKWLQVGFKDKGGTSNKISELRKMTCSSFSFRYRKTCMISLDSCGRLIDKPFRLR